MSRTIDQVLVAEALHDLELQGTPGAFSQGYLAREGFRHWWTHQGSAFGSRPPPRPE